MGNGTMEGRNKLTGALDGIVAEKAHFLPPGPLQLVGKKRG